MNVIINADDFGGNENATNATFEALRLGLVTTATAIATGRMFERAMDHAQKIGWGGQVGLHFNLTSGTPLTEQMRECRTICDANGKFMLAWHRSLKNRLWLPSSVKQAIAVEAEAQMRKYIDCGGTLMHFDSHNHVHTDYSVASAIFPVARRLGFRSTRLSRTIDVKGGQLVKCYKKFFNQYARRAIGVRTDEFTDYNGFMQIGSWNAGPTVVEVMVHPLFLRVSQDSDVVRLTDMGRPMVHDSEFWEALRRFGVHRANYKGICD